MRSALLLAVLLIATNAPHSACQANAAPPTATQEPAGTETNPAKVSSGIMAGSAISQPRPVFEKIPCGVSTSGGTVLRVVIDPEGKVHHAEVVSGPQALREGWLEAVRNWTYKPYLINGRPVWVNTIITSDINFGKCDPKA